VLELPAVIFKICCLYETSINIYGRVEKQKENEGIVNMRSLKYDFGHVSWNQ
jgi:hypothetical protein